MIIGYNTEPKELNPTEKKIYAFLKEAGFYLQTYRAIEANHCLDEALMLVGGNDIRWWAKVEVYKNKGQAEFQLGHFDNAMDMFGLAYETAEDVNDKAALAGLMAGYYLQENRVKEAKEYAEKALMTATAPVLSAHPYQILGGIAVLEGDYLKAIELMNKAASLAEENRCLTDLAMIIMDLSAIYMRMGMKETALSEIYRAERYVKECHNLDLYMRCAIRRAKILYAMGKDEEAKKLICALEEQKN